MPAKHRSPNGLSRSGKRGSEFGAKMEDLVVAVFRREPSIVKNIDSFNRFRSLDADAIIAAETSPGGQPGAVPVVCPINDLPERVHLLFDHDVCPPLVARRVRLSEPAKEDMVFDESGLTLGRPRIHRGGLIIPIEIDLEELHRIRRDVIRHTFLNLFVPPDEGVRRGVAIRVHGIGVENKYAVDHGVVTAAHARLTVMGTDILEDAVRVHWVVAADGNLSGPGSL